MSFDTLFMGFPDKPKRANTSYYKAKNDSTQYFNGTTNTITATLEDDVILTSFRVSCVRTDTNGFTSGGNTGIRVKIYKGSQLVATIITLPDDFTNGVVSSNFIGTEFVTSPLDAVRGESYSVVIDVTSAGAGQYQTVDTTIILAGQYKE